MNALKKLTTKLFDPATRHARRMEEATKAHNDVVTAFSAATHSASLAEQAKAGQQALHWAGKVSADSPEMALGLLTQVARGTSTSPHAKAPELEDLRGLAVHQILELAPLYQQTHPDVATRALSAARHAAPRGSAMRQRAGEFLGNLTSF